MSTQLLVLVLLTMLVGAGVGRWMYGCRRLQQRIRKMRQDFARTATGEITSFQPLAISGNDDVAQACKAFNLAIERALQESEAKRLDAEVFNRALEGIVITDQNGIILKVNPAFTRVTGYSTDESVGNTLRMLKSGRQDQDFYENMWSELKAHGQWQGEIWNRRKNGEIYPEWLSISCVRSPAGEIENFIAIFSDITLSKQREKDMAYHATHDPLTDLPNRALLMDRAEQAIAMAERLSQNLVGVIFLDLDGFKPVNDSLGHRAGDMVLKEVAARLLASVRHHDTVARLGGDEFTIIVSNLADCGDMALVAKNIIQQLELPFNIMGKEVKLSASLGISCYPYDGMSASALIHHADEAMYTAKRSGKGRYQFYSKRAM